MISTGNDIVALNATCSQRTIQPRFYSKILSAGELELYQRQEPKHLSFEKFVWLIWSVKESAYKYLKRVIPELIFSPAKTMVRGINSPYREYRKGATLPWENNRKDTAEDFYACDIICDDNILYSRSKIHDELIATVVSDDYKFEDCYWGIRSIPHSGYANQSKAARIFMLNRLHAILPGRHPDLNIRKNAMGCPLLLSGTKEMNIPLSLAHHDQFIAYSFLLSPIDLPTF